MLRRLILALLAVVTILVLVAAGAAYWFFSRDGLRRALEAQATAWLGHPVRIGRAGAQFLPRPAIQLGDVRVGEPVQLTLADVDVSADLRPLFDGRLENAALLVSGSQVDMPLPFALPRGPSGEADTDAAVRIVSIRSIALRDVTLRSRGRDITISADSSLEGSSLTLSRFDAESGNTRLSVKGEIDLAPRLDATLQATANRLDLDELLALADAFTPPAGETRRGAGTRITATVTADAAAAGALQVERLSSELTLDGDAVELSRLSFEIFGGRYEGSMTARLGEALSATLRSRVTDIDVARLAAFGGSADTVSGRLTGNGTFTGTGADMSALLRSARGRGTTTITDGSIRRLHLLRTIVLFFGRPAPDADAGTDHFDRIDVAFSLADRVARAETFVLQSADADMRGSGSLNLQDDVLSGRLDVILSEALSKQAGTDLYRYTREGNRIVLPAALGGTLGAPRLTIDAAAAARRGLRNEVERRLKGVLEGFGR
jgi:uncharacterized protein involved in outer membrane biogenesis